jgi:hypothetical protein
MGCEIDPNIFFNEIILQVKYGKQCFMENRHSQQLRELWCFLAMHYHGLSICNASRTQASAIVETLVSVVTSGDDPMNEE